SDYPSRAELVRTWGQPGWHCAEVRCTTLSAIGSTTCVCSTEGESRSPRPVPASGSLRLQLDWRPGVVLRLFLANVHGYCVTGHSAPGRPSVLDKEIAYGVRRLFPRRDRLRDRNDNLDDCLVRSGARPARSAGNHTGDDDSAGERVALRRSASARACRKRRKDL